MNYLPSNIYLLAFAAVFGGIIGSVIGSRMLANTTFYYLLALVLAIAGIKLILGT